MKMPVRQFIGRFGLTYLVLFTVLFWVAGCATRIPDPLAGWHAASKNPDQVIVDDYQNYIQGLSPEEKKYLGPYPASFFEDGTGQHAVRIEVDIGGKDAWYHILFYDKDNKRIKVIKYFYGRYIS
jgi:hypothetical protein